VAARAVLAVIVFVGAVASWRTADAQEHATLRADVLFYGDNAELRNPFREGETILGAAMRGAVVFDINDRVRLSLGAFGNVRFGGDEAFELVRPVVSLTITGQRSIFVFGTLPAPIAGAPPGPDRTGPHGLLPPLQRETLAFDRPFEAGLAWTFDGAKLRHRLWIDWQRLNTRDHRERFDAGLSADLRASAHVAFPIQLHVVHEGGQLFAAGPVADSAALASGVHLHGQPAGLDDLGLELFGLLSRDVPDRGDPDRSHDGAAFFGRAAVQRRGWRAHLIVWRGKRFIKNEGDASYLSLTRDGEIYRGTRDYAEAGLCRTFTPAEDVLIEASARLHRTETHYEYSFRILATTSVAWKLR